ncbi:LytR C-terminal domain-containing protein [Bifidobacterium stellenboschense]|uniref:LytR/CpsA/Psr regulator C-terminal domain-containing protein n=1 Tax=Bifidobacterium stellenboschense TaxID=762211 RepID=A0A087E0Y2_9BIFI|nr:LytR C-terminal domain-containing protein [Bifidobacterium stellenboschense]KFJ01433.1 hypothetical protein BSTEL_1019 [Bifidobacterium stellenboschense]
MAEEYDEREARKAYVRRRQKIVFSITGAILVVVLIVASLFYTGVIQVDQQAKQVTKPNYGVAVPCAAKNEDGTAMKWADNNSVILRVRNGTKFTGLGAAVGEALKDRQFDVRTIDTYTSSKVARTTIYFGVNAINPAYTIKEYIPDAVLVMDDRQDRLVDVVIGATFNDLNSEKEVKKHGDKIKDFEGCQTVDALQKAGLRKADKHTDIN